MFGNKNKNQNHESCERKNLNSRQKRKQHISRRGIPAANQRGNGVFNSPIPSTAERPQKTKAATKQGNHNPDYNRNHRRDLDSAKAQERGSVMLKLLPLLKIVFPKNINSTFPVFLSRETEYMILPLVAIFLTRFDVELVNLQFVHAAVNAAIRERNTCRKVSHAKLGRGGIHKIPLGNRQ